MATKANEWREAMSMAPTGAGVIDQAVKGGKGWADVGNPNSFYVGCKVRVCRNLNHPHGGLDFEVTVTNVQMRYPTRWERSMDKMTGETHGGLGTIYFQPAIPAERGDYLLVPEMADQN